MGLKDADTPPDLKLAVCRKAYDESRIESGREIADLLGSLTTALPDDAVAMLDWLAAQHPDPDKELWNAAATDGRPCYGGEILTHGINTVRGRAAEAIRDLILTDAGYIARFGSTINHLVADGSLAVRACAASVLLAVARSDMPLGVRLFQRLAQADDRLFTTHYVQQFVYYAIREHFVTLRRLVERMLRSPAPDASEAGARFASLAVLLGHDAQTLVDEAMAGSPSQRPGVAEVAAQNIAVEECRTWCDANLRRLFSDTDSDVRRKSASFFYHMKGVSWDTYESLLTEFSNSAAYGEGASQALLALDDSVSQLPGTTCLMCEEFLTRFGDEARDIRTHRAADAHLVAKLVFRTYHQHQRDEWGRRCLDLIDRLCLEAVSDAQGQFEAYER